VRQGRAGSKCLFGGGGVLLVAGGERKANPAIQPPAEDFWRAENVCACLFPYMAIQYEKPARVDSISRDFG